MPFQLSNIHQEQAAQTKGNYDIDTLLKKDIVVFKKPFSNKIKEAFYGELSVLLIAGISLKKALELILSSQKNAKTKVILESLVKVIIEGQSFSEAIKHHSEFSDYEYYSLKIGEETGAMPKITEQLAEFYAKKNEQRRQIISALTYPCIILGTAILVVTFMLQFVVPMFQDIFKQQNVELPAVTLLIIKLSDVIRHYRWLIILVIGLLFSILIFVRKHNWYRKIKGNLLLKLPFIGKFIGTVYLSQFTQSMLLLTASKVSIVDSIKLVRKMIDFYPLLRALIEVENELVQGQSFSSSLEKHELFDDRMITMIKVSEETNQTEYMFSKLSVFYNSKVENSSKILSTILEPFIIVFIGAFVGFILIAMYLPMFRLSSLI